MKLFSIFYCVVTLTYLSLVPAIAFLDLIVTYEPMCYILAITLTYVFRMIEKSSGTEANPERLPGGTTNSDTSQPLPSAAPVDRVAGQSNFNEDNHR